MFSDSTLLSRALLGGTVGLLPVGLWWLYLRHRAGKSYRRLGVVLVVCLFLIGLAGLSNSLEGRDYGALVKRGYDRFQRGNLVGARADSDAAIALNSKKVRAYMLRGLTLLRQGKDAEAQKDFERVVELRPDLKNRLEEAIKDRWILYDHD